ncbi:MFS general substrate transporter [Phanerochaete sordida]|uniref:MFS general substrate transporter n=1 Tax=Phanerochaete sordida TaxID=48140 RepID=A0A9P3LB58_9APHY|nr:MFS general substrate transporter [Phanerochaete sordida]
MTTAAATDETQLARPETDAERGERASETATIQAPEPAKLAEHVHSRDFGFLPIPRYLRVSKEKPPQFDIFLNILFGLGSTFIVSNLYYCQPLLIQLSESFHVTYDEVSRIPTLVQAGYACGLLLITPLGDLVRRRALILVLISASSALTIGLPLTSNLHTFEALSFLIGVTSVVPQILMPFAADLAPPHKRGAALSIVLSGLLLGILFARVVAGVVANFVTWRVVYWLALGLQGGVLLLMYARLPDFPRKNKGMTYLGVLYTMARFAVTEPMIVQASLINIASMACFTNFWVTLTFLLGGPIYNYSTLVIGLFGLVGMGGVATSPLLGRLVDRMVPWYGTLIATTGQVAFYALQTGADGLSVGVVIVVCFGIDSFRQFQQVSLTTGVFGLDPSARARMNAVLIISIFIGQIMGTSVGTSVFNAHGWRAAAALNLGWEGFCVLVLLARGPHCARYTWLGWEGGFAWRKPAADPPQSMNVAEDTKEKEKEDPQELAREESRASTEKAGRGERTSVEKPAAVQES